VTAPNSMLPAIQVVPVATCGAKKKRTPGPCSKPAGWRTEHPGQGKCYLHGGATPIKHGRYSSITRPRVRELIEKHEADADPLNILPELAAARALFEDFVERYDHWRDALLAWHKSYTTRNALPEQQAEAFRRCLDEYEIRLGEIGEDASENQLEDAKLAREFISSLVKGDEGKPREVLDLSDAVKHADTITKIVERIERIRGENAISRRELHRTISEMGRVVETYVTEKHVQEKIREGWLAIRI
jgi:hypothetical protein